MPYNSKDDKARIHVEPGQYEVWVHHSNKEIELVASYANKQSAIIFIRTYNGQTSKI